MRGAANSGGAENERGFILVVVAWILAALATLASVYALYATYAASAAHIDDDRLRIRAAAISALELTAYKLTSMPDEARPPRGVFGFALEGSRSDVGFMSEGARVDLNAAPRDLLAGLFAMLGANPDQAGAYAERVVAWRKSGIVDGQNPEAEAYKKAGYAYSPRQAPFRGVLELGLVRGIPPDLAARALDYVTIFSGRADIDFRVADAELLRALPSATPDKVKILLDHRGVAPRDAEGILQKLGPTRLYASATANPATRVGVKVRLDNGREARVEAVILVSRDEPSPYRILSWSDDVDSP